MDLEKNKTSTPVISDDDWRYIILQEFRELSVENKKEVIDYVDALKTGCDQKSS